jgi:purine-nucleoside phosphorylase
MEVAGLYGVAAELGKKALCLLTVSEHIKTGEKMSVEDRQLKFGEMIEMTLESIV